MKRQATLLQRQGWATHQRGWEVKGNGKLVKILGKNRLIDLCFDVPKGLTPQQSVILNEAEGDMPSESDVAQANDIELQEIAKSVVKSTEDLIA